MITKRIPTIPVILKTREVVITRGRGPHMYMFRTRNEVVDKYDQTVAEDRIKERLTAFIAGQGDLFKRQVPDPAYVAKLVIKHARRQLTANDHYWEAIDHLYAQAREVIGFYVSKKQMNVFHGRLKQEFTNAFEGFDATKPQRQWKAA